LVIPLKNGEISDKFGTEEYLVIDKKDSNILFKKIIKNPYSEKGSPHGARFVKAIRADKVFNPYNWRKC